MGLREWLMIFGGLILLLIAADGIRRMRKDKDQHDDIDDEERERQEQLQRELPFGKARIVKSHDVDVFDNDPIPVLRHEVEIDGLSPKDSPLNHQDVSSDFAAHTDYRYDENTASETQEAYYDDPAQQQSGASYTRTTEEELAEDHDYSYDQMLDAEISSYEKANQTDHEPDCADAPSAMSEPSQPSDLYQADSPEVTVEAEKEQPSLSGDNSERYASNEPYNVAEPEPMQTQQPEPDDLEPLEPTVSLEQGYAAAQLQQESEYLVASETESESESDIDPVQAAVRRIQGKHTGPRPSERIKPQPKPQVQAEPEPEPEEDTMSLAEREYIQLQAEKEAAEALALKQAEQLQLVAAQARKVNRPSSESTSRSGYREKAVRRKPLLSAEQEREQIANADELLVLHVKCKDQRGFHGAALLHVVMQCGMQIGDMQVFHRFEKTDEGPRIQFSMLSSIEPGVFDLDQLDELYIPSVSFVMGLPAPGSSGECFRMMLETAKVIVRHMNGELRDENRSVMTQQTIDHYKQRIQEFERRKQLARMR